MKLIKLKIDNFNLGYLEVNTYVYRKNYNK